MEIILRSDITAMDSSGQEIVILLAGTRISAISTHHIAKNSVIHPFKTHFKVLIKNNT